MNIVREYRRFSTILITLCSQTSVHSRPLRRYIVSSINFCCRSRRPEGSAGRCLNTKAAAVVENEGKRMQVGGREGSNANIGF